MSDSTPLTPGNDAHAAATGPAARPAGRGDVKGVEQFQRKAYAVATSKGYGNAMGRGFELAITLLVMVGIGWLADSVFDTRPTMIIVFSVLGFVGTGVKLYYGYDLEMREHEDGAIWNRKPEAPS